MAAVSKSRQLFNICRTHHHVQLLPLQSRTVFHNSSLQERDYDGEIKLVIFDKDGTLIDFKPLFGPWLQNLIGNMSDIIPEPVESVNIWDKLGYKPETDAFVGDSIVARGTNHDIRNTICEYIAENQNSCDDLSVVKEQIEARWIDLETNFNDKNDIKVCGDLDKIFTSLKDEGVKIAVCTCDDREPTEQILKTLEVEKYIDMVVCGDDQVASKPSPDGIRQICTELDIPPSKTMMVGDTIADIDAGINAKCAKVFGVLSGGYDNSDLKQADKVIPSIDEVYHHILG
eukprot:33094_1